MSTTEKIMQIGYLQIFWNLYYSIKKGYIKNEIPGATLINYLKAIKVFSEMSDLSINWKKNY